jgi:hypothetical protein
MFNQVISTATKLNQNQPSGNKLEDVVYATGDLSSNCLVSKLQRDVMAHTGGCSNINLG